MAVSGLRTTIAVIAARNTVSSAPTADTNGYRITAENASGTIRALITKTGAITSARVRLYTREPGGTAWYRGSSTDDVVPIPAGEGNVSYDFAVGEGVEFTFVLEAIAPSGSTPTVAVKAAGVSNG